MNNDLTRFSRARLAQLGREYMAAAQFNSRVGYAAVRINHGEDAYKSVAIDNWMAASPIYTRRMQRAMGFADRGDVESIFKGLQLECGLTHQYFDAQFEVSSPDKGRFWLARCGPLLETEPRGDDAVKVMCHDVEDPTFDATAVATNPRARMRPVHRPPRAPEKIAAADSGPHCEWNVFIDATAEALGEPEPAKALATSALARLEIPRPATDLETGGMADYSGELHQQLHLESLSHSALVVVCKELALQNHLLIKGMTMVVEKQYGREAATAVAQFQMQGSAHVVAARLLDWLRQDKDYQGIDAIIAVLGVHPLFQPMDYQTITLTKDNEHSATLSIKDSVASGDNAHISWLSLMEEGFTEGLDALMTAVVPGASCRCHGNGKWTLNVDSESAEAEDSFPVQIAKGTVLYQTHFKDRIQLLELRE